MNEIQEKAEDRYKLALEADLKHLDSFKYKTYEKVYYTVLKISNYRPNTSYNSLIAFFSFSPPHLKAKVS